MANEKNLKRLSAREARENGRKGGKARAKSRREKRTIRELVDNILSKNINEYPAIFQIAEKLGIENCKNVKELMTLVTIFNTVNTAKIDDLEKISKLLGEDTNSGTDDFNQGIKTLAALINNPVPNRNIADFEGDDDD